MKCTTIVQHVVSASSLQCNSLSLSYALPDKFVKSMMCKNINVSANVTNLFSIVSKDFKGRDAEVATGQQPRTRTYTLNVGVTF